MALLGIFQALSYLGEQSASVAIERWLGPAMTMLLSWTLLLWFSSLRWAWHSSPSSLPRQEVLRGGLWFAFALLGNGLTGALSLLWGRLPIPRYSALLALLSMGAALALWTRLRGLETLYPHWYAGIYATCPPRARGFTETALRRLGAAANAVAVSAGRPASLCLELLDQPVQVGQIGPIYDG
jgi:hypothetical protein